MTCKVIADGKGGTIIACTRGDFRGRCTICGSPATALCDYPLRGSKEGKTCDMPLCRRHAVHVGNNRDMCPVHSRIEP